MQTVSHLLEHRRTGRRVSAYHGLLISRLGPLHGSAALGTCCTALSFCSDDGEAKLVVGDETSRLQLWRPDYAGGTVASAFDTGHTGSILCARFLAGSGGSRLVCCSTDRQVRLVDLNKQATRPFLCHRARVKALASVSPDVFLSASEDGTVRLFDIRQACGGRLGGGTPPAGAGADPHSLLVEQRCERSGRSSLRISINSLAVSPLAPHLFATGGGDPFARVYDMRMVRGGVADQASPGAPGSSSSRPSWVSCYAPYQMCSPSLMAANSSGFSTLGRVRHLTGIAFAAGGQHLLLSYSGDAIYSVCMKAHAMSYEQLEGRLRQHIAAAGLTSPARGDGGAACGGAGTAAAERSPGAAAWEFFTPPRRLAAPAAGGRLAAAAVPVLQAAASAGPRGPSPRGSGPDDMPALVSSDDDDASSDEPRMAAARRRLALEQGARRGLLSLAALRARLSPLAGPEQQGRPQLLGRPELERALVSMPLPSGTMTIATGAADVAVGGPRPSPQQGRQQQAGRAAGGSPGGEGLAVGGGEGSPALGATTRRMAWYRYTLSPSGAARPPAPPPPPASEALQAQPTLGLSPGTAQSSRIPRPFRALPRAAAPSPVALASPASAVDLQTRGPIHGGAEPAGADADADDLVGAEPGGLTAASAPPSMLSRLVAGTPVVGVPYRARTAMADGSDEVMADAPAALPQSSAAGPGLEDRALPLPASAQPLVRCLRDQAELLMRLERVSRLAEQLAEHRRLLRDIEQQELGWRSRLGQQQGQAQGGAPDQQLGGEVMREEALLPRLSRPVDLSAPRLQPAEDRAGGGGGGLGSDGGAGGNPGIQQRRRRRCPRPAQGFGAGVVEGLGQQEGGQAVAAAAGRSGPTVALPGDVTMAAVAVAAPAVNGRRTLRRPAVSQHPCSSSSSSDGGGSGSGVLEARARRHGGAASGMDASREAGRQGPGEQHRPAAERSHHPVKRRRTQLVESSSHPRQRHQAPGPIPTPGSRRGPQGAPPVGQGAAVVEPMDEGLYDGAEEGAAGRAAAGDRPASRRPQLGRASSASASLSSSSSDDDRMLPPARARPPPPAAPPPLDRAEQRRPWPAELHWELLPPVAVGLSGRTAGPAVAYIGNGSPMRPALALPRLPQLRTRNTAAAAGPVEGAAAASGESAGGTPGRLGNADPWVSPGRRPRQHQHARTLLQDEQRDVGQVGPMELDALPPPWGLRSPQGTAPGGGPPGRPIGGLEPPLWAAASESSPPDASGNPTRANAASGAAAFANGAGNGPANGAGNGASGAGTGRLGGIVGAGGAGGGVNVGAGGGGGPGAGGADGGFLRCFDGHKNVMTIKEVAWMGGSGSDPAYVASGSDEGHVFIWEYDTGEIVRMLPVQEHVIPTCLAVHPFEPMLAACGNGTAVKLWAPGGGRGSLAEAEAAAGSGSERLRELVATNRADLQRRQAEAEVTTTRGRPVGAGWATFAAAIRERSNDVTAAVNAARAEIGARVAARSGTGAVNASPVGSPAAGPARPRQRLDSPLPQRQQASPPAAGQGQGGSPPLGHILRLSTALERQRRRSGSPEETIPAFGMTPPAGQRRRNAADEGADDEDDAGAGRGAGGAGREGPDVAMSPRLCNIM